MKFKITNDGNKDEITEIKNMLEEYNTAHGAKSDGTPIAVYCEDEDGRKLAGITGIAFGNWLSIHFLFVSDTLRGQGIGARLIALAENEARAKGCKYAYVTTNSFQAPGFYTKLGYKCVFTQKEFPVNGEKFHLIKEF